jgi:hypothetical protein
LNHVIVINEWHLRRILKSYFSYYHRSRTHLSLDKDARNSGPFRIYRLAGSFKSEKSADCIIATNASLLNMDWERRYVPARLQVFRLTKSESHMERPGLYLPTHVD